jgi:hypothetical protein
MAHASASHHDFAEALGWHRWALRVLFTILVGAAVAHRV